MSEQALRDPPDLRNRRRRERASSPRLGSEQEYFLDRQGRSYQERQDLQHLRAHAHRVARRPRGTSSTITTSATIPDRVMAFMTEVEQRLCELGVPVKTRHNEVAPGQYEIAPTFESTNIAADHQMLMMHVLRDASPRDHGFVCLLHEKPFAGVNGSGKHNNWALCDGHRRQPARPTGGERIRTCSSSSSSCGGHSCRRDIHADLLRASASPSAGNDHRLGANEAPPAIMSVSTWATCSRTSSSSSSRASRPRPRRAASLHLGAHTLPADPASQPAIETAPARSRSPGTSSSSGPWARRRARSPGRTRCSTRSSPNRWIYMAAQLERPGSGRTATPPQVRRDGRRRRSCSEVVKKHRRVVFDGDNYAAEWHRRGRTSRACPTFKSSVDALAVP